MQVAIYSRSLTEKTEPVLLALMQELREAGIPFYIFAPLAKELKKNTAGELGKGTFTSTNQLQQRSAGFRANNLSDSISFARMGWLFLSRVNSGQKLIQNAVKFGGLLHHGRMTAFIEKM